MITRRHSKEPAYPMQVEHIWLRISLLPYPYHDGSQHCRDCGEPESDVEVTQNNTIFTNAVQHLLQALALISVDKNGRGVTLEFSASSPSDSEHFFKSWYHLQRDYPHLRDRQSQQDYIRKNGQKLWENADAAHGFGCRLIRRYWAQTLALTGESEFRVRYSRRLIRPLKFVNKHIKLPEADIVTGFLIRRQFFRDISTSSLRKLLQCFPSLRILRRENWRPIRNKERTIDNQLYAIRHGTRLTNLRKTEGLSRYRLIPMLPRGLIHLQLFEDFEIQLHGKYDVDQTRYLRIELLPSLAVSAPYLQHLAIGFLTDAIDCFGLRDFYGDGRAISNYPTYLFPHLKNVILTSQEHLCPDQEHDKINALLRAAAAVALKMPKLGVMELWNCTRGHACLFRYDSTAVSLEQVCVVTWRSNWGPNKNFVLRADMIEAWEQVALTHHSDTISLFGESVRVEYCPLPAKPAKYGYLSYGSMLKYLRLADIALHPTSAMQVSEEAIPSNEQMLWYQ